MESLAADSCARCLIRRQFVLCIARVANNREKIPIPQEMNVRNRPKCANRGVDKGVTRSTAMLRMFWSRLWDGGGEGVGV